MRKGLIIVVAGVVLLAVAAAAFFVLNDNPEVTESAGENAEQLEAEAATDVVFRIDPEQSTVEFAIDEVLRGEDVTVVGTTQDVAGDIRINVANPSASEIGEIRINARSLMTDQTNRNRAIRQVILKSGEDQYEFITFNPTSLSEMPEAVEVGTPFEFTIVGDLTILDTTNEVTFNATVTPVSETEISGSAEAVVMYADWGIIIPEVPFVASVEDDVILTINFVATEAVAEEAPATEENAES